jgi:hypothetical protein
MALYMAATAAVEIDGQMSIAAKPELYLCGVSRSPDKHFSGTCFAKLSVTSHLDPTFGLKKWNHCRYLAQSKKTFGKKA